MQALLSANLASIHERIRAARPEQGQGAARLLAVTKTVRPEVAAELAALGQLDLGENRPQGLAALDAADRIRSAGARLHFIGQLQRNKARRVVRLADEIHSVDRAELIETLGRVAAEEQRQPRIYLQLKLWPEENKTGLAEAELDAAIEAVLAQPALVLQGLMVMAPWIEDAAVAARAATEVFERCAAIAAERRDAGWAEGRAQLSMGMSGDLEAAVRAGSDWLRIGSALFEGLGPELRR